MKKLLLALVCLGFAASISACPCSAGRVTVNPVKQQVPTVAKPVAARVPANR